MSNKTNSVEIRELNQDMLGNTQTIRANSSRGEEVVKIALDKVVIRDNFNVRTEYGDLQGLAQSILENGQTVAGRVDVLDDGTFVVVEGHRRFSALKLLESQGHAGVFKAIVNGKRTTEEQRIMMMFTTQDSKPLLPHEVAELFQRLINIGYKPSEIATKVGKSKSYVSDMLSYAAESKEVKDVVKSGKMTVNSVLALQKDMPSQARRTEAVKKAVSASNPKNKVTSAEVVRVAGINKKQAKADEIATALLSYMGYDNYPAEEREGFVNLIKSFL